jgi:hypothetical protein
MAKFVERYHYLGIFATEVQRRIEGSGSTLLPFDKDLLACGAWSGESNAYVNKVKPDPSRRCFI